MKERIKQADKIRKEVFKKPFDFSKKEEFEVDPDKRDFAKTEKELQDNWRKQFKHSFPVFSRFWIK